MNKDIEKIEIEEHFDDAFSVSLPGVMPVAETSDFGISGNGTDAGECFSVTESVEEYSFVDGCEQLINQLCLVIGTAADIVREVITRKYKMYCERAEVAVLDCAPDFLRL